jgi:FkbM family methyltransferase
MNFSAISRTSSLGALLRLPLRLIPPQTVLPILQGRLRSYRWITGSSNHGCWLGSYEYEKQQLISQRIPPGSVVYDIGAHVGFYTLLFSHLVGSTGQVVAFEPFPANLAYLQRHLALNHITNVQVIAAAVAAALGSANFAIGGNSSEGHLVNQATATTLTVNQVSLDILLPTLPPPAFLKLDIEGAELAALQGARDLLVRPSPHHLPCYPRHVCPPRLLCLPA